MTTILSENKLSESKSPEKYSPKRILIQGIGYKRQSDGIDFNKLPEIDIMLFENDDHEFNETIDFEINIRKKDSNIVYPEKFTSFLCDLELFNWSDMEHNSLISRVSRKIYYDTYTSHLINKFGSDITLLGGVYTENYENNPFLEETVVNRLAMIKNDTSDVSKYINEERKKLGLKYKGIALPFFIKQIDEKGFGGLFSTRILRSTTRYLIVSVNVRFLKSEHFTFLLIDYKNREIEYYDPYGGLANIYFSVFMYRTLKSLFEGYKIHEFWKLKGIQATEFMEKDRYGFCVIWGHIMIHLKLLNINKSMNEIENSFIEECYRNKLSLYEVMLNYAYYMLRIIPSSDVKFVKFDLNQKLKT